MRSVHFPGAGALSAAKRVEAALALLIEQEERTQMADPMKRLHDFVARGQAAQAAVDEVTLDAHYRNVNELVKDAPAMGCYCMGIVEALVRQELGRLPPRELLAAASKLTEPKRAIEMAENYVAVRTGMRDVRPR